MTSCCCYSRPISSPIRLRHRTFDIIHEKIPRQHTDLGKKSAIYVKGQKKNKEICVCVCVCHCCCWTIYNNIFILVRNAVPAKCGSRWPRMDKSGKMRTTHAHIKRLLTYSL